MLASLPLEIQLRILSDCPTSSLKFCNSHFFLLYNDLFQDKLLKTFGESSLRIIAKIYPWLRVYIKSLDCFRYSARVTIASRLRLVDNVACEKVLPIELIPGTAYIKDSWKYIFSIFKNKRLFAEYADYEIDEPTNYVFNHYVEINRSYLLSYKKSVWLAPGRYNLNIGLVVKSGSGLGTTKFEISHNSPEGSESVKTFYPPSNINEILPKNQFCFLKIADFEIPRWSDHTANDPCRHQNLVNVKIVMEEIGLYLKSGFTIFFIDISQPSMIFNDFDLLYYSCPEVDYKHYINLPLKNLYKALNYVQSGGHTTTLTNYGVGNPTEIESEYDFKYEFGCDEAFENKDEELMAYANFFYRNSQNKRTFKFNTVFQKRQFVHRFGDYTLESSDEKPPSCIYDLDGLKWRIPIMGEL